MRVFALAAALVALTALPVAAQIGNPGGLTPGTAMKEPGTPAPHQPNAQDRLFYSLAGAGGMAEVDTGRVAEGKANSPAVKEFARRMAEEHSKAYRKLAPIAKAARVAMPETLDADHKVERAMLERLNGSAFDLAYMRQQLVDHQKTVTLLQWEIGSGQDGDLQRYAMENLPVVLEHLEMAQAIIAELTGAAPQGLASTSRPARTAESDRAKYSAR